ncbi:ATP-grasp domain-containing protein [Undibacterium fentianense]|uniref:RimK family alpha-L-glutamate ligase n=1 Tax=Undibacterium fentianense TaxID=2828728 RepID=A0A941E344_9BURK|nr:RimK family alpha-L-glutamate ligase [Undibacterium fentianense]MBR7800347.1 RimK family alpha-L-glutamate ligase [Undibacterium fentianense]
MTPSNSEKPLVSSKLPLIGLAPLMRKAFSKQDLQPIAAELIERAKRDPNDANASLDLATVLMLSGHADTALATQMLALQTQSLYHIPAQHPCRLKLLVIMTNGDLMANTPVEFLLENSDIDLQMLYVGEGIPAIDQIPEHDVLFVAIGEADGKRELLLELDDILQSWPRPVLNYPRYIAELGRDRACRLLQSVEMIEMPTAARISRAQLQNLANEACQLSDLIEATEFPIIARPLGSHAGNGLRKIMSQDAVADYLAAVPSEEFYIARFVDYRSPDGLFRKYRIMLIEGKPFISHMGISKHWMIHYLNAGMTDSQEKRDEEARFMMNFDNDFVVKHAAAFDAIYVRTGLDYIGIDCGETSDGKLLIFEADSDMIVHAMDPIDLFPYKQAPMHKLFQAFRAMLLNAADAKHLE